MVEDNGVAFDYEDLVDAVAHSAKWTLPTLAFHMWESGLWGIPSGATDVNVNR